MMSLVLTGLFLAGLPIALLLVFRASAAALFFSMCVGLVVLRGVDDSLIATAASIVPTSEAEPYVRLLLFVVFLVIGSLLSKGAIRKTPSLLSHGFLVLLGSFMLWSALPGLTELSWLIDSTEQYAWDVVSSFQTIIVAVGFITSLLLNRSKNKAHDKHK